MQYLWIIPSLFFGGYMAATTGAWHLLAMSGLTAVVFVFGTIVRTWQKIDLTKPIEFQDGYFWVGRKRISKLRLFWRSEWNEKFFEYFESQRATSVAKLELESVAQFSELKSDQAFLGFTGDGELVSDFVRDGAHLLIIGPTGSGKSKLLQVICGSILASTNAQQANFAFIDYKGGATFDRIRGDRINFSVSDLRPEELAVALAQLGDEIARREQLLAKHGVASILDLRKMGIQVPTLYVVCDEFASLVRSSKTAAVVFEELLSKGRSLGLIVIMASQSLAGIPRSMLVNIRQKIALTGVDAVDLHLLGFPRSVENDKSQIDSGIHARWIGASSRCIPFVFPAHFALEKTLVNRHFSA